LADPPVAAGKYISVVYSFNMRAVLNMGARVRIDSFTMRIQPVEMPVRESTS
jgi:hypothetical protein